ncbi:MAG: hypothetical protein QNJ90_02130 [Planctomycetota bacterium]|nr:hypothetical protein [Planctomycetota bacterium]
MAAKTNTSESQIDKTSFWYGGLCGICHPGGGGTEFDRDGELYYDVTSSQFGYEKLGMMAGDVTLDGDYAEINNKSGALRAAPWDVTGVAEPDCLLCHRLDRTIDSGKNMNWIWRTATLRAKDKLEDGAGGSVPAYAAAATAAQGWFSTFALSSSVPAGKPPMATDLGIDYQVGVTNGSLVEDAEGNLRVNSASVVGTPVDYACWGCHVTPDLKKRGRIWFDEAEDVHYAGLNNLDDADVGNDIPAAASNACTYCHPSGLDHNIAKGNAELGSVRNDTDYVNFRSCRECHLPGAEKDPAAPEPTSSVHTAGHLASMSCEFCHIPYKTGVADWAVDNATTGSTISYKTNVLLSADPLNPMDPDKTRWYPAFKSKVDSDGVSRLFPVKRLLSVWWGDWDDKGTMDKSDDQIRPIALWRVRPAVAGLSPTDDDSDGKVEVNTPTEIAAYIAALKGNDSYGNQIAANPVLVKGGDVYYDATGAGQIESFDYEAEGVHTESSHPFSINHNVRTPAEALGSGGCGDCHGGGGGVGGTPVFDRLIPVDPFRESDGTPFYKTVRELTGVSPF